MSYFCNKSISPERFEKNYDYYLAMFCLRGKAKIGPDGHWMWVWAEFYPSLLLFIVNDVTNFTVSDFLDDRV